MKVSRKCLLHGPLCQVQLVDQSLLQSIAPGTTCACASSLIALNPLKSNAVMCLSSAFWCAAASFLRKSSAGAFCNERQVHIHYWTKQRGFLPRFDHTEAANTMRFQCSNLKRIRRSSQEKMTQNNLSKCETEADETLNPLIKANAKSIPSKRVNKN